MNYRWPFSRRGAQCVVLEISLRVSGSCAVRPGNVPRAVMRRDEGTTVCRKNEGCDGKSEGFLRSVFPPSSREQEARRKERRRSARRGRKRSVIPGALCHSLPPSPLLPVPVFRPASLSVSFSRRAAMYISESVRRGTKCFSPMSLTALLLQRRRGAPAAALAEPT